jgi:protein-S-isoprenylcysteine O-methyltransferase Ste14
LTRRTAALGTAVFFALAPGVVAGVVPWFLTGWHPRHAPGPVVQIVGLCLVVAGFAALISAFVRFVVDGIGTPAPLAPTEHLVVSGLYRYVRNPMYVAVVAAITGQAMLLGDAGLVVYASAVAMTTHLFVLTYEEPTLSRRFGPEYAAYRRAVRRWLPRGRPWDPNLS